MYGNYAGAAGEIARDAGLFLKRFSDDHHLKVEKKGSDYDFVTNADRESQRMIENRLKSAFPGHRFVGEEDGLSDADVAELLSGNDFCWVCDPLDGTINYIHKLGIYAVSIGLVRRGESLAGAIYLPETDELFTAARGEGAFLNGRPIRVSGCSELRRAFVTADLASSNVEKRPLNLRRLSAVGAAASGLRVLGSACVAIANVACGRQEAYWNVGLHAWDVAAGIVLVEEAGGEVTDVFGGPFRFDMKNGFLTASAGLNAPIGALIEGA